MTKQAFDKIAEGLNEAIAEIRKPTSYPFLAIAKKYNIPYALVLDIADYNKPSRGMPLIRADQLLKLGKYTEGNIDKIFREIIAACRQFRDIQAGRIDWNTGEPVECYCGGLRTAHRVGCPENDFPS